MEKIREDPLEFLESMYRTYGPVTFHETERDRVYSVFDPELVSQVMMSGESRFTKQATPDDFMLTPLLGCGLLTSHGETWERQRSITQPMFARKRVEGFLPMMHQEAVNLCSTWAQAARDGHRVRVDHDLTAMALRIVARAMLGADLSGVGHGFGKAVDAVNAHLSHGDPRDTPDTDEVIEDAKGYPRGAAILNSIVAMLIEARKLELSDLEPDERDRGGTTGLQHESTNELLSSLLSYRDPVSGMGVADDEIHSQVLTMIMAGHETTAKALTWTLFLLDQNREVLDRVRSECIEILGGRPPGPDLLASLKWTRSAIQEAMRLYPPIWVISRRAMTEQRVGGFDIEPGSLVCVSPWILHHDPKSWPSPNNFNPARFLEDDATRDRHAYLPFGLGPRQCIGRGFALMEAVVTLSTIVQALDLKVCEDHQVIPQALVTLRPKFGLFMDPHELTTTDKC